MSQTSITEIVIDDDEGGGKKGENQRPQATPTSVDVLDGDQGKSLAFVNNGKLGRAPFESVSVNGGCEQTALMQLPFPPGADLHRSPYPQAQLLMDPLKHLTLQKKPVNLTRDLPMPTRKLSFLVHCFMRHVTLSHLRCLRHPLNVP